MAIEIPTKMLAGMPDPDISAIVLQCPAEVFQMCMDEFQTF